MDKIEKEVLTITDLVEVLRTIATTPSLAIDETVLESISDEKLVELQESIAKTKHAIELENLLYTRYLERTQQLVGRGVGIPDKDNDNKLDSDKKQDDKEVSKKVT